MFSGPDLGVNKVLGDPHEFVRRKVGTSEVLLAGRGDSLPMLVGEGVDEIVGGPLAV